MLKTKFAVDFKQWTKLSDFIKPYHNTMGWLAFTGIFSAFIQASYTVLTAFAIENFVVPKSTHGLMQFSILFVSISLIQCVVTVYYMKLAMIVDVGVAKDIKSHLFRHVQELSIDFFNKTPVGALMAKIVSDTDNMGRVYSWQFGALSYNIFYIIFAIVNMFFTSVPLALCVMIIVPIMFTCVNFFQMKMLEQNRHVREKNMIVSASFNENISGLSNVKELNIYKKITKQFHKQNDELKNEHIKYKAFESLFYPTIMCFNGVIVAVVLGVGSSLVFSGEIDVANLSVFVSYSFLMINPIEQMIKSLSVVVSSQANVERINELARLEPLVKDSRDVIDVFGDVYNQKTENFPEMIGEIEFKNVSFKYPDSDIFVLENFNLTIKAGTTVAIVGHTGAGKSTLVNLVCRFFEPTSGEILIDGVDYRKRSISWIQSNLSYVLQSPHLFSGTIEQNIRFADQNASMNQIIEASKRAKAHDFIEKLPDGYQTDVGQGGDKLSTGQKQLVSIARAILADGKIFVMDEATSSVDTHTEMMINDMTFELMRDKTSFIIAHRLSTVKNADIILVVENGKIIEQGNHRDLLSAKEHYYELYTGQWEDFEQKNFFEKLHK